MSDQLDLRAIEARAVATLERQLTALREAAAPFVERDIIKHGALSRGRWREYQTLIEVLSARLSPPQGDPQ